MPRRRHEDDMQYYMKKIRKIERKMKRRLKRRRDDDDLATSNGSEKSPSSISDSDSEVEVITMADAVDIPVTQTLSEEAITMADTEATPVTQTLSEEVLSALGDLMPDKPTFGPAINSDLARIWSNILKNGLVKETKQKLMEQLLIPENCPLLKAPKLNEEISTSVILSITNRDKRLEHEQNQLGLGLAIISNGLSMLINNDTVDRLKLISLFSDAGRILTDLHFGQSKSRKALLYPVLDKKFLDVVKDVERDDYIYGTNLSGKIRLLRTCHQTGQSIKKVKTVNQKGNLQGPPRYNQGTAARQGQKKFQTSMQARKNHSQHYQSTAKKSKARPEKPRART